ncbi:MAG: PKD domain-containing protein [Acidobacteriota bacterium]
MRLLLALAGSAIAASRARAVVIAEESLAYAPGPMDGVANGGIGWNGAWITSPLNAGYNPPDNQITPGNMAAPVPLLVAGNRCTTAGNDVREFRFLDLTRPAVAPYVDATGKLGKDGTTIWIAFLAALATGPNTNVGNGGIHLFDGLGDLNQYPDGDKAVHERVFMGDRNSGTNWFLGRTCGGCSGATIDETTYPVTTAVHLLVYRFDFLAGDETVRLWVDPAPGPDPANATADVTQTAFLDFRFDTIELGSANVNGGPMEILDLDELRIATTYQEAVPPANGAPVADFTGAPLSGPAPLSVQLTDRSTGTITSWAWTFGDGATATTQSPAHTYGAQGTYTVGLSVTGPGGQSTLTRPGYITVTGSAPLSNFLSGRGRGLPNPNDVTIHALGGSPAKAAWTAYGAGQWGTLVAAGDVDGDLLANPLTGPGPGPAYGPQVRAFQPDGTAISKVNFYAYATLRWGVNVGAGDLDGDLPSEILSGAGPGGVFGPHVRGFNYDGAALAAIAKVSFVAFGTLKYGVNVDAGDVDSDGFAEIVASPGPSAAFGATVRGFDYDGATVGAIGKINFVASPGGYGAIPRGGDVDGDAFDEIVVGRGPGPTLAAEAFGFDYDATAVAALPGFDVVPFTSLYGLRVACGDVDGDGTGELASGPGEDPTAAAAIASFDYAGGSITPIGPGTFSPFTSAYGAVVASGVFGY